MKKIAFIFLFFAAFYSTNGQIITTVAGTGTSGYSGDGGPATAAALNYSGNLINDNHGNLYFTDCDNNCIRKIDITGVITTIAGNGSAGYSGDGGAATAAELFYPHGVTVDNYGNIFIADQKNNCVREVNTSGTITTIAGNGSGGYSGDGGAATAATLNWPTGIALDNAGNIYVTEYYNSVVRKISTSGIISTYAGNGSAGYSGDGGPATDGQINGPYSLATDQLGNVYIADCFNYRIRKVDVYGVISTIAGTGSGGFSGDGGPATAAQIGNSSTQPASCVIAGNYGNIYC
jgi:hypothetical protein